MKLKFKKQYLLSLILVSVIFLFIPYAVHASLLGWAEGKLIQGFGWIIYALIFTIGKFVTILLGWLVQVASWSNFINVTTVQNGWTIVRDMCNMFFILILLVIAFATILRQENYSAKKLLPKLLIMAVLINFSKTICGLITDFSQVIMLTFINGVNGGASNNLITLLGFKKMMAYNSQAANTVSGSLGLETVAGLILALLSAIVVLIVIVVMMAILVMRVIMIWIYVILSPLAFLAAAFPAGQKYSSQWWGEFSKQVVVGPVLAFFLWLALVSAQSSADSLGLEQIKQMELQNGILTGLLEGKTFQTYIITLGLLMGGLMVAQQMGGMAASIAGKGLDLAKKSPFLLGKGALGVAGWGARKIKASTGLELRPTKVIQGFRETLKAKAEREEKMGESKAGAALKEGKLWGALGASRDFSEAATRGFLWHRGWAGEDSVIGQTYRKGKLQKEINNLNGRLKTDKLSDKDRQDIKDQIVEKRKELSQFRPIETFYADEKRNTMVRETMKKLYDNDNADDLHSIMMSGFMNGQEDVALAAFLQMYKVGHSNEAMEMTTALENYEDENGKVIINKGEYLPAGIDGLKAFAKQYLMGQNKQGIGLKLSQEETMSMVMQASTMAKSVRHANQAEAVGSENGNKFIHDNVDQRRRSAGENKKMDQEQNMRQGNRLFHGDEVTFKIDYETGATSRRADAKGMADRVMVVTELSKENFNNSIQAWERELNAQKRLNPNLAENIFKNFMLKTLKPEIFKEHQQQTYVDVGKDANLFLMDSKNSEWTSSEKIAWQTIERGLQLYKTHITSDKNEDQKRVAQGLMTQAAFAGKWKFIEDAVPDMEKRIENGLKKSQAEIEKSCAPLVAKGKKGAEVVPEKEVK